MAAQIGISRKDAHLLLLGLEQLRRTYMLSDAELERTTLLQNRMERFLDQAGEAQMRVFCACGCGREVQVGNRRPRRFFSPACRQREFRNKRKNA